MNKILTEIFTEINLFINEERTEEEFIEYLQNLITKDIDIPNFVDIMLSQYRSDTYLTKIVKYEVNTEQDLTLYLDIPLKTGVFRNLLFGFTVGDLFFVVEELVPQSLRKVLLRKLFFVGSDKFVIEVKGVSPSLITEGNNSFEYRETQSGEPYLYWYNQHPAQIGCLSFSKMVDSFMSGYISLGVDTNLPRANFPKLWDWVEANPDNILSLDLEKQLIIFPEALGSYLQTREENFALVQGSQTIPADTTPSLSDYYAASDVVNPVKFKPDVSGQSVTYMSPTSVPREETILLEKGGKPITRLENSRGVNILIKAV